MPNLRRLFVAENQGNLARFNCGRPKQKMRYCKQEFPQTENANQEFQERPGFGFSGFWKLNTYGRKLMPESARRPKKSKWLVLPPAGKVRPSPCAVLARLKEEDAVWPGLGDKGSFIPPKAAPMPIKRSGP